jgi:drug/metabolite transporter (DMT)-like permease
MTIATATATASADSQKLLLWTRLAGGISVALLLWPMRRRRVWPAIVLAFALMAGFAMAGCGGSWAKSQTYTVSVSAAGGSVTQSTTVTLMVKN